MISGAKRFILPTLPRNTTSNLNMPFPTDKEFLENRYSAWSDHFAFKDTGEVCGIKIRSNHALLAPDVLTLEFEKAPPGCLERMRHICQNQTPPPLTHMSNLEDRIAALEERVNELTQENAQLKDRLREHEGPDPVKFDMQLYEANEARYGSMRDAGKLHGRKGKYGLFLSDGRNLVFELESSALMYKEKVKDESAYVTMLHGEGIESIGPLF